MWRRFGRCILVYVLSPRQQCSVILRRFPGAEMIKVLAQGYNTMGCEHAISWPRVRRSTKSAAEVSPTSP